MKASIYNLPHFRVDYQDWIRGNNVADNYPNGGLLSSETGFNPFKYEGLVVAQKDFPTTTVTSSLKRAAAMATSPNVDQGTGIMGLLGIAGIGDPNSWGLGRFYTIDPDTGAMTAKGAGNTSKNYRRGWTDTCMIGYDTLFTSATDITKVTMSGGTATIAETWGTSNGMSGDHTDHVPHPIIVGDTLAYVADGNELTQVDLASSTVTKAYFTHIPSEYVVTAGIYHRGYFYLAAAYWYAAFGIITNAKLHTRIFLWDGFSQSFADDFYIDDTVTAMHRGGDGTVFVWTTKHFGYLSGSTFVKLRKIVNKVYKCDIIDVPNGVMYAEGTQMVRYSAVVPGGRKAFFIVPFTPGTPDTTFSFSGNSHALNVANISLDVVAATDVHTIEEGTAASFGITNGTALLYTGPSHDVFVNNTTYYAGNVSGSTLKLYSDAGLTTLMNSTVDTIGHTFSVPFNNSYVSLSVNPAEYGISAGTAIQYTGTTSGGLVHNTVYYAGELTTSRFSVYSDSGLTTKVTMSADVNPANFSMTVSGSETIIALAQLHADYPIVFTDHGTPGSGKNLLYGPLDNDTSGTNKSFRFNRRITRVPVKVRGVVIETDGLGASGTITVSYYNSEGTLKACGTYSYAIPAHAARKRWGFEVMSHPTTTEIDPVITISGTAKFKSVDFYYERSENDSNT